MMVMPTPEMITFFSPGPRFSMTISHSYRAWMVTPPFLSSSFFLLFSSGRERKRNGRRRVEQLVLPRAVRPS